MLNRRPFLVPSLLLVLLLPGIVSAAILPHDKVTNGGYILFQNNRIIEQFRADQPFIPASTIKLLTAYTALTTLGDDFRFTTSFSIDADRILYIQGGGDPVLTTESLIQVARELKNRGVTRISAYVLDDSAFQLEQPFADGSENSVNPYDVNNSGLAVNFNSIAILKKKDGSVASAEEQTPLTPLGREIAGKLPPGRHRVNIDAFRLRSTTPLSLRYSAELLHALLAREGVDSRPVIRQGSIPRRARLIYQHSSLQTVREIVTACLHVSNNFMANQLALTAGAVHYGYPATWEKSRRLLTLYAREKLEIPSDELQVREGSGLSRQTRVTPAAMLKILRAFEPYRELLPQREGAQLKSGSMKGVYCYAGYMDSSEGSLLFAMLLNQQENTRQELMTRLRQNFLPKISQPAQTNSPLKK